MFSHLSSQNVPPIRTFPTKQSVNMSVSGLVAWQIHLFQHSEACLRLEKAPVFMLFFQMDVKFIFLTSFFFCIGIIADELIPQA